MKEVLLAFVLTLFLPGASFAADLTVAVAANVQFVFDELKDSFEKETGVSVKTVVGSSGKLTSQIENGAPFDVFLSADTEYPQALYNKGLAYDQPRVYAYGTLVLWTFNDLDLSKEMKVLADPSIKRIAIPIPISAPYGREAVNALKYFDLYESIEQKLVYGESVAQTNQFIVLRAGDIGFTAKSVVLAPNMQGQGKWVEVEGEAYEPIAQAVVVLKSTEKENLSSAQMFYDFLFSQEAREIFKKYGYMLPEKKM